MSDSVKYRLSTLVRVLELLQHGVIGPEPVFAPMRECLEHLDEWSELSEDWISDEQ